MDVPKFLQPYLASYNLKKLDMNNDKEIIITEILNKGDGRALHWLIKSYSKNDIKNILKSPLKGYWMKSILKYWLSIFGINLKQNKFNQAIINLDF
mgnify:FL=1